MLIADIPKIKRLPLKPFTKSLKQDKHILGGLRDESVTRIRPEMYINILNEIGLLHMGFKA